MNTLELRNVLVGGLWLIDNEGWSKTKNYHPAYGYCAMGAVNQAATGDPRKLCLPAYKALQAKLPKWALCSVAAFNDHPDTVLADVRGLFVRAIAALDPVFPVEVCDDTRMVMV